MNKSDILKERIIKRKNKNMFKDLEKMIDSEQISSIQSENHEFLYNAFVVDELCDYDKDFLQSMVISESDKYLVLYKKEENVDIKNAYIWYKIDNPTRFSQEKQKYKYRKV